MTSSLETTFPKLYSVTQFCSHLISFLNKIKKKTVYVSSLLQSEPFAELVIILYNPLVNNILINR